MVALDYRRLLQHQDAILRYALKTCDAFSVVDVAQKPYSRRPPVLENAAFAQKMEPFAAQYLFERSDWPVPYLSRRKHSVMVIYRIDRASRRIVMEMPGVFQPAENDLPEDICFFRDGHPWLITVSHEQIAYLDQPTLDDLRFLESVGIGA